MHRPYVQRIVQADSVLELHGAVAHDGSQNADDAGKQRGNVAHGGRDRCQPGNGSGQEPDHFGFAHVRPFDAQPGHSRKTGCQVGVDEGRHFHLVHTEFAARIETEPAEPQQRSAQGNPRDAVRMAMLDRALANEEHRGDGGKACGVVHHHAAGKIKHAPLGHHAVRRPDHVDEGVVDKYLPQDEDQAPGLERHAVGKRAGDQRGRDDGKHHLVGHVHQQRDSQHRVVVVQRVQGDVAQEGVLERITDDAQATPCLAKGHGIAHDEPHDGGDAQ